MLIYNTWKGVARKESRRQVHKHINSDRRGAEPPVRGQVGNTSMLAAGPASRLTPAEPLVLFWEPSPPSLAIQSTQMTRESRN